MVLGDKPNLSLKNDKLHVQCQGCDRSFEVKGYTLKDAQKNKNGSYTFGSRVFYKEKDGRYVTYNLCPSCKEEVERYG